MAIQLSQKERMLLEDQKGHEEICVEKYKSYAKQAQDPQLKDLFNSCAQKEQEHLDSVTQMLQGQVPDMAQQQQNQNQGQQGGTEMQPSEQGGSQKDAALCNDMLMTEKYVSGTYDTAIFEFKDTNMRKALNHIQKEEQEHGEGIFNYMSSHGMYQTQ
jgi:spore coat protein CotF